MHKDLLHALQSAPGNFSKSERKSISHAFDIALAHSTPKAPYLGVKAPIPALDLVKALLQMKLDTTSICTGLLHEAFQEGELKSDELKQQFDGKVAAQSTVLQRLASFAFPDLFNQRKALSPQQQQQLQQQAESFRRMLISMASDLRVILIRVCQRLCDLRRVAFLPLAAQQEVVYECRAIYAPLANRLGISWLKNDLEDLTLRYLHPHAYYDLVTKIASKQRERDTYIKSVRHGIQTLLNEHALRCDVMGRSKHINSIYRKLQKQGSNFEDLYDILAFRVLCDTKEQCYQILGMLHAKWVPIPGRFKDYIAMPKPNMYQSLHTTVLGPDQKRMEIQIRTHEMHQFAEEGIAAHWVYKEGSTQLATMEKFQWLRSLLKLQEDGEDAHEFMASLQDHLQEGEIFVFTPKGEVREFPRGATPVDFAYAIHTKVGERCSGAKVNGKIVPLRYDLRSGDVIEIMTSPSAKPNRGWLEFVKTSRARTKISSHLRTEQRAKALTLGRELLEKQLPSSNRSISKLIKSNTLPDTAQALGHANLDEMFMNIGYGKLNAVDVVDHMFPPEKNEEPETIQVTNKPPRVRSSSGGLLVGGMDDVLIKLAKCCKPIPGDAVIGFISRGQGVVVHRQECINVRNNDPARLIDVSWSDGQEHTHTVTIEVLAHNRPGILSLISKVFANLSVNISSARCETRDEEAVNHFDCQVSDTRQLKRLVQQLEEIRGVSRVKRLRQ